MQPKPIIIKSNDATQQKIVVPSKVDSSPDGIEGEEIEIAVQITVPHEGGWGWIVVTAAFWCIGVLDGIVYTFGSLLRDIADDLGELDSLIALINSIAVALYFIASPLASAFINRFGFRSTVMTGSVLCSISLFCSYFTTSFLSLCTFYGFFAGIGYSLINMSSCLIVGFYFEKLRSLALSIAVTGSSVGVMLIFPLNVILTKLVGWRVTTLLHSGLFGTIYFVGMTYRPLLSLTVMKTTDESTRTVTYLPSLSTAVLKSIPSRSRTKGISTTVTERLFSAVSNANFPTAAAVVEESIVATTTQPGPSTAAVSRITLKAHNPQGGISRRQLKQVQSLSSNVYNKGKMTVEVTVEAAKPKKPSCWGRLCSWEQHVPESRPMYRDDVFYEGKVEKLPAYQKSMMDTSPDAQTGLEYQMAVSRAVTTADLQENRGVFTTAARRILATMMDPTLLKRRSFLALCLSGFFTYVGYLVPYVFIQDRNQQAGINPKHCNMFVSTIGFANCVGRLVIGALACKVDPLKLYCISCVVSGISTMLSNISFNLYYQYFYCCVFGFFIASLSSLRSMLLVNLYGLERLTNSTGMMLLFHGLGSLISTPLASILKNSAGYSYAFSVSGIFISLSGLFLIPIPRLCDNENKIATSARATNTTSENT